MGYIAYIQNIIFFVALRLIGLFRARNSGETRVFVKLDGLGDFVLAFEHMWNFFKSTGTSSRLVLVVDDRWVELAEILKAANNSLEIELLERNRFSNDVFYKLKIIKKLFRISAGRCYNFNLSRDFHFSDLLCAACVGSVKYGTDDTFSNYKIWERYLCLGLFDFEHKTESTFLFEYFSLGNYFASLGMEVFGQQQPGAHLGLHLKGKEIFELEVKAPPKVSAVEKSGVLLLAGSSAPERCWDLDKFILLGALISKNFGLDVTLCAHVSYFQKTALPQDIGKTNLFVFDKLAEFANLAKHAAVAVGNDSGLLHLSIAVGVQSVLCISNGNHWGRFLPYPLEIVDDYRVVLPFQFYHGERYGQRSSIDINTIGVAQVFCEFAKLRYVRCA